MIFVTLNGNDPGYHYPINARVILEEVQILICPYSIQKVTRILAILSPHYHVPHSDRKRLRVLRGGQIGHILAQSASSEHLSHYPWCWQSCWPSETNPQAHWKVTLMVVSEMRKRPWNWLKKLTWSRWKLQVNVDALEGAMKSKSRSVSVLVHPSKLRPEAGPSRRLSLFYKKFFQIGPGRCSWRHSGSFMSTSITAPHIIVKF